MSHVKCWVQTLEFDARVAGSELAVYFGFHLIAAWSCGDLLNNFFAALYAPCQALFDYPVDLDLGHIKPTTMLGYIGLSHR